MIPTSRTDDDVASISLSADPASTLKADAVVVGVTAKRRGGLTLATGSEDIAKKSKGLLDALAVLGAEGKPDEVTKIPAGTGLAAPVVVAVGIGEHAIPGEALRRAAGAAARALAGTRKVALALPATTADEIEAVAQGALLGGYTFRNYRSASAKTNKPGPRSFVLASPLAKDPAGKAALAHAVTVTDAMNLARDLVNTPPRDLYPEKFGQAALEAADSLDLEVTVLDDQALLEGGYGGIMGVGQGSAHLPRLVRIAYRPPNATKHLAIVGKGITFDTGGISIKPAQGMEAMKSDMGGAAAVLAALTAIARLKLAVNVTGWAPMAENMPSGSAQRPSDVITIYGGKTVEVLNTDAEGRLILADALVRASEEDPDLIVDAATLTGAQVISLGSRTAGIMSNDDDLRNRVFDAATRAGEQAWPMPLPDELRKSLDSQIADIANISWDRVAGMLTAGVFLKEFIPDGKRWAHIDIAGPAFHNAQPVGYLIKGGTGAAVRTFVQIAQDLADGTLS